MNFDVIVVGAGPAGTTAALILARHGLKVALVERGEYPGAKNMFGGAMFGHVLNEIIPEYWTKAPVERYIHRKMITLLAEDSAIALDFETGSFNSPPYNGFVIQRSQFDRWYAAEAERAGAVLLNQTIVEDLIWEGDQVVGVKVGRAHGEMRAKVVIAADGVLSILARKAGLQKDLIPKQFSLGVKEVIQLPPGALEERFRLTGEEGLSNEFLGKMGDGLNGGGFIYTNKQSLSIGVVVQVHSLQSKKASIYEALEKFKRHPVVAPLLDGGQVLEYSAHLIPEAGIHMVPKLFTGGMLVSGDAAGLLFMGGIFLEGVNFAMESGRVAAESTIEAFEKGNFTQRTMAGYEERLKASFVLKDLRSYKPAQAMLLNPRLYEVYPTLACNVLEKWFRVDGSGHAKLMEVAKGVLSKDDTLWQFAKDGFQMGRSMVW